MVGVILGACLGGKRTLIGATPQNVVVAGIAKT